MEKRLRIAVTLLAILFVILTITCANLLMWSREYRGQINERFQENFNELCSGLFSRENSDEKLAVLRGKAESCGDLFMLSSYRDINEFNDLTLSLYHVARPQEMQKFSDDELHELFTTLDRMSLELGNLDYESIAESANAAMDIIYS